MMAPPLQTPRSILIQKNLSKPHPEPFQGRRSCHSRNPSCSNVPSEMDSRITVVGCASVKPLWAVWSVRRDLDPREAPYIRNRFLKEENLIRAIPGNVCPVAVNLALGFKNFYEVAEGILLGRADSGADKSGVE